ncbi:MAG: hypothetical protein U1E65_17550 [Myxococcota bacterium]
MIPAQQSREIRLAVQVAGLLAIVAVGYLGGPEAAGLAIAAVLAPVALLLGVQLLRPRRAVPTVERVAAGREPFPNLGSWLVVGASVHVLLALALDLSGTADSLAPDHQFYRHWGQLLVVHSSRPLANLQGEIGYNPTAIYYYFNAVAWFLAGPKASLLLGIFNGGLHLATAYLAAGIAYQLYDARAARICFLLVSFMPSLVVYSSLNIRDALSWLLIVAAVRGALMVREPGRLTTGTIMLATGVVGMGFVRPYIMLMLLISFAAAQVLTKPKRVPAAAVTLIALVIVGAFAGPRVGVSLDLISSDGLKEIQIARATLDGGGSAAGFTGDVSSPGQALLMVPKGLAFFLLSPYPWEVRNFRQAMAVPEVLIWGTLLVLAARQLLKDAPVQPTKVATLVFPALAICLTYALMEGNAGTANRHRGQMAAIVMVFASQSLASLWRARRDQSRRTTIDAPALRRT